MISNKNRLFLALPLLLGALISGRTAHAETLQLHAAVESKKVAMRVDFLGGAMGNRMKVYLRNRTSGALTIHVAPGTIFVPQGDVQRLAAIALRGELNAKGNYFRRTQIQLNDTTEKGFLIGVVCIDYHKSSPRAKTAFTLGGVDARCQRILSVQLEGTTTWGYQAAMWMDRAGVSAAKLQGTFGVSSADITIAKNVLRRAEEIGVQELEKVQFTSPMAKKAAEAMYSSDPNVRASAHARITAIGNLSPQDKIQFDLMVQANIFRGGKKPSREELQAGSTSLAQLIPQIKLPKIALPSDVRGLLSIIQPAADQDPPTNRLLPIRVPKLRNDGLLNNAPFARLTALKIVAKIEHPLVTDLLIVMLKDKSALVRSAAGNELRRRTGQDLRDDYDAWLAWLNESNQ